MPSVYQQARAAGLNPNHWYAVARSSFLKRGKVLEATFWGRSIAVFRAKDGSLGAMANRCVHRNIKLSLGHVCDKHLVCPYHGWEYDTSGRVARIPHDLFGRSMPDLRAASYPVRERYGLVWIFPGDRIRAEHTPLPEIPELEGPRRWASVDVDFMWRAHFSIIVENLLDFTHAYLHRKYRPFEDAVLVRTQSNDDAILAEYETAIGAGRFSGRFVNRGSVDTSRIASSFDYPYQRASTHEKIKHWCFLTPIDAGKTQIFFTIMFDSDALRVPVIPLRMPYRVARFFLRMARRLMIAPLLQQDQHAVEAEQEAFERLRDAPFVEFNPIAGMVQELIVRKWRGCEMDCVLAPAPLRREARGSGGVE